MAFSLDVINVQSVDEYHVFGWKVLQKLHDIDSESWPDNVGKDSNSPSWSMCFNGMQLCEPSLNLPFAESSAMQFAQALTKRLDRYR